MTTPTRRLTAGLAVLVVTSTLLSGCAQVQQLAGTGVPVAGAGPTPTASEPAPTEPVTPTTGTPVTAPARTPSPSTGDEPDPAPTPDPVVSAVPEPTPTPTPTTTEPPKAATLRYGDSGPQVRRLQDRLSALGYWLAEPDGTFGPLTQQAVFALQKAAGLDRDGVVGPKTRAALEKGVLPEPRLTGNGVEIDLDRQLLVVVDHGKPRIVLNTSTGSGERYTSSAGNPAIATTPTGRFTVFREVNGQDDSELGELWRPKYFHRGYAVHGSPNIPPYPASHGCARVSDAAMDMLWYHGKLKIGTTVSVY